MTHLIQFRGVSGLATCGVCQTLVSFEVSRAELERFEGIRCPRCKAAAEIHHGTVIPVLEVTTLVTGGLE
jgi:NAD-dependent SIR2 family protein deacetylase